MTPIALLLAALASSQLAQDAGPAPAAAAPVHQRVLLVGDSHSDGGFGVHLLKQLSKRMGLAADGTARYASCGSAATHWAGKGKYASKCGTTFQWFGEAAAKEGAVPELGSLIQRKADAGKPLPDVVVIALGTNPSGGGVSQAQREAMMALAQTAGGGAKCFWVGPPNMRAMPEKDVAARYAAISDACAQDCGGGKPCCSVVDSRPVSEQGDCDQKMGLHYCAPRDAQWASGVAAAIAAKLGYK